MIGGYGLDEVEQVSILSDMIGGYGLDEVEQVSILSDMIGGYGLEILMRSNAWRTLVTV